MRNVWPRSGWLRSCFVAALAAGALCCSQSREQRLAEARADLLRLTDSLYQEYGGSEIARGIEGKLTEPGGKPTSPSIGDQLSEIVRNSAQEMDRSFFEEACDTLGRGQHPALFTDKARAFFEREETLEACRRIVALKDEIARLESALAQPPR